VLIISSRQIPERIHEFSLLSCLSKHLSDLNELLIQLLEAVFYFLSNGFTIKLEEITFFYYWLRLKLAEHDERSDLCPLFFSARLKANQLHVNYIRQ